MVRAKSFLLPFLKRKQLTKDVYSFYFDRAAIDFDFLPGQYIQMRLPHQSPDVRGTTRYFTIASSPLEPHLMVTTKMIQSTFKEELHNLTPEKKVSFFGPMGKFVLDETDAKERVFISGGMGITPFRSMLTYIAQKKLPMPITLFVSFSSEEEILFYEELSQLAAKHTQIKIIYTISDKLQASSSWKGEKGKLSKTLLHKYLPDVSKHHYYIVGSPKLVVGIKELLKSLPINEEKILTEDFTGY